MMKNRTDPVSVYINQGNPLPKSMYTKKHRIFNIPETTP